MTSPLPTTWFGQLIASWRGERSANLTMAKAIAKASRNPTSNPGAATLDLLEAGQRMGADMVRGLDLALGGNIAVAEWFLDRGVVPSAHGLRRLAEDSMRWNEGDWSDMFNDDWAWIKLTRRLIEQDPRHPGWIQPVSAGNPNRVIGQIGLIEPSLEEHHGDLAGHDMTQQIQHLTQGRTARDALPYLVRGYMGAGGERVGGALQAALVEKALKEDGNTTLRVKRDSLAKTALVHQAWETVDVLAQALGTLPEKDLVDAIEVLGRKENGLPGIPIHEDDYMRLMLVLGEHLPVDFDFSRTVDICEINYFDDDDIEKVRIDTLLGEGFQIVESGIRYRKLMAQHAGRVAETGRAAPKM